MLCILLLVISLLSCESWELWAIGSAVLVHECGHVLALRLWGERITALRLDSTGAELLCPAFTSKAEEISVALAGSTAGLLWALALARSRHPESEYAAAVSAALSFFNLLPVPLLDGGRVLLALGCRERRVGLCATVLLLPLLALCIRRRIWLSALLILYLIGESIPQGSS